MLDKYLRECLQKINLLIKKHFKKEIYMCVVNEQDSQFPGSHWVILYHDKQNTYFTDSLGRDFAHYGLEFKRLVYKVSGTLTCLGPKLCRAYLVFFGCRLARGLDLNSVIDYFTCDGKVNNEFIYDCINEKL